MVGRARETARMVARQDKAQDTAYGMNGSLGVRVRPSRLGDALSRNDVQCACLCRRKEGGCQQPQVTSMGRCWGVGCPAGHLRIPCWTTRHTEVMREKCPRQLSTGSLFLNYTR